MDPNTVYDIVDDLFLAFRGFERFEEPGRLAENRGSAIFGWGNWLTSPTPILMLNTSTWMDSGDYTVDYTQGTVTFDNALSAGDEVRATYTMRLFPKSIYASFAPIAFSFVNAKKPQTNYTFSDAPDLIIGPLALSIYIQTCKMCLLKMGMFKWRRLFENPDDISNQLRQNISETTLQLDALLATLKRRGNLLPSAVTMFNIGRVGAFVYDEINWQSLVVAR